MKNIYFVIINSNYIMKNTCANDLSVLRITGWLTVLDLSQNSIRVIKSLSFNDSFGLFVLKEFRLETTKNYNNIRTRVYVHLP
jgi:hypothetical protein